MPIEKIIVIEDDLIVRKNLEQQLRKRRYDVAAVESIAAAREYLAKDNWDLLLADIPLPDGEGTELLRELNGRPEKPLVVMMSGFGSIESAVECMREGAFDYLVKPYSNEQIDAVLGKDREQQVAFIDPLANLKIPQCQHTVAVAPLVQNRLADSCVLGNDVEQPRLNH